MQQDHFIHLNISYHTKQKDDQHTQSLRHKKHKKNHLYHAWTTLHLEKILAGKNPITNEPLKSDYFSIKCKKISTIPVNIEMMFFFSSYETIFPKISSQ